MQLRPTSLHIFFMIMIMITVIYTEYMKALRIVSTSSCQVVKIAFFCLCAMTVDGHVATTFHMFL